MNVDHRYAIRVLHVHQLPHFISASSPVEHLRLALVEVEGPWARATNRHLATLALRQELLRSVAPGRLKLDKLHTVLRPIHSTCEAELAFRGLSALFVLWIGVCPKNFPQSQERVAAKDMNTRCACWYNVRNCNATILYSTLLLANVRIRPSVSQFRCWFLERGRVLFWEDVVSKF